MFQRSLKQNSDHEATIRELKDKIVDLELDLQALEHEESTVLQECLDPDPYGLHRLTLEHRFSCMIKEFGE